MVIVLVGGGGGEGEIVDECYHKIGARKTHVTGLRYKFGYHFPVIGVELIMTL